MSIKKDLFIPYYSHLKFAKWLIDQRDALPHDTSLQMSAINANVITNCCIVLEGFLFTIMRDLLYFTELNLKRISLDEKAVFHDIFERILTHYNSQLDRDTWNDYIGFYELFADRKLTRALHCGRL